MLLFVFFAAASLISYGLGLAFGDDLTTYWRIALLFPVVITLVQTLMFLSVFRYESPRWILSSFTKNGQLVNEAGARKMIRRMFRRIYKSEIVEDVLERECSIFKKTVMEFKPSYANMFFFPYKFRLFAGIMCSVAQ